MDSIQYSNFDWTDEQYAYTIFGTLSTRTSPARRKMAGKRNRLGRVYELGKALSEPLREEIIEMYNEGFSVTDISNDVRVTVREVNKIINLPFLLLNTLNLLRCQPSLM